ncbi:MAG TPA: type II toxin-antitoxin system HicB family antitoxin [Rubrivivax sp.]|nr:type II toxin-antitoxin system HicB family antitoxin [Rubrivivax sp.]
MRRADLVLCLRKWAICALGVVILLGIGYGLTEAEKLFFPGGARGAAEWLFVVLVGRILGVRSIISFHGQTVRELRSAFERAIKEYLADCAKDGLAPEKPASGKLLLRVPPEVHGRALIAAQAAGKSLNQWATEVLQHAVEPAG